MSECARLMPHASATNKLTCLSATHPVAMTGRWWQYHRSMMNTTRPLMTTTPCPPITTDAHIYNTKNQKFPTNGAAVQSPPAALMLDVAALGQGGPTQLVGTTNHSSHLNQSSSMKASTITVAQSGQCHSIRKVRLPLIHVASNIHQGLQHSHYLQHTTKHHSLSNGIPFGKSACHQHGYPTADINSTCYQIEGKPPSHSNCQHIQYICQHIEHNHHQPPKSQSSQEQYHYKIKQTNDSRH